MHAAPHHHTTSTPQPDLFLCCPVLPCPVLSCLPAPSTHAPPTHTHTRSLLLHSLKTLDAGAKNSKTRSKYDTDSAWFWMLAGNTSTVTGTAFDIAREVLPDDFSIPDTALFFARAALANYDTQ